MTMYLEDVLKARGLVWDKLSEHEQYQLIVSIRQENEQVFAEWLRKRGFDARTSRDAMKLETK
jgi:hypothetical protein